MDFNSFNNFAVHNHSEEGIAARFYDRTVKTAKLDNHGFPIFEEVCFCEIRLKDNLSEVFDQPATEDKKRRFSAEYAHYLQARKQVQIGTPLEQFAFLSKPEVEALKVRGIYSIEALSELDDAKAADLGVTKERDLAQKFKQQAEGNLNLSRWQKQEEDYKARIHRLEEDIQSLRAGLTAKGKKSS